MVGRLWWRARSAAGLVALAGLTGLSGGVVAAPAIGPGYFATDNVGWVSNIPLNADSAGGKIVGKTLYVTDDRGLTTYDISVPSAPRPLGFLPVPQQPYAPEEDVDTNGRVLVIGAPWTDTGGPLGKLNVIDVRDPARPTITATVDGADAHTVTCVLDCRFAWLNSGDIVDLRNLEAPRIAGNWLKGKPARDSHDVTEVSPGLVVTSSNPVMLLDARKDPLHPKLLATGRLGDNRYIHAAYWPRGGTDRYLLIGGETGGTCDEESSGAFMVFDTKDWQKTGKFRLVDEHRVPNGFYTEGRSPYSQFCAHWFTPHPTFRDGGLVAMAWYEAGTRFLDVSKTGQITEKGYFLPLGGSTSSAVWVNKTTLYAIDYQRGIDVITFSGKNPTREIRHPGPYTPRIHFPRSANDAALARRLGYLCPAPGR